MIMLFVIKHANYSLKYVLNANLCNIVYREKCILKLILYLSLLGIIMPLHFTRSNKYTLLRKQSSKLTRYICGFPKRLLFLYGSLPKDILHSRQCLGAG